MQEKRMKPKGKGRGKGGVVTKTVPKESFFNFFAALEVPEDPEELEEDEVRAWPVPAVSLLGPWSDLPRHGFH